MLNLFGEINSIITLHVHECDSFYCQPYKLYFVYFSFHMCKNEFNKCILCYTSAKAGY